MTGLREICRDIRAKCPYCNRSLDLTDLGVEIFRRVTRAIAKDDKVEVDGFGVFHAPVVKGRTITGFGGMVKLSGDKRVIRFRASPKGKKAVNEGMKKKGKGSK